MTSFIALLIAVPVSFGIAMFLTEVADWLKRPLGIAVKMLAAVPSIVYRRVGGLLVCSARFWPPTCQQPAAVVDGDALPTWVHFSPALRLAWACWLASSWP